MKSKYLIDTDWVIHHLKGFSQYTEKILAYKNDGIAISIMSVAELYEGVYYSKNPAKDQKILEKLLSTITPIDVNEEIAKRFAAERGKLRKRGLMIGDIDLFIASTALCYNMVLLTDNTKHFDRIDELTIESMS